MVTRCDPPAHPPGFRPRPRSSSASRGKCGIRRCLPTQIPAPGLASPNDLLAIGERNLQRESIGSRHEDFGHVRIRVGAEEGDPSVRLVHQHDTHPTAGRPSGCQKHPGSLLRACRRARRRRSSSRDAVRPLASPMRFSEMRPVTPPEHARLRNGPQRCVLASRRAGTTDLPSDVAVFRIKALAYAPLITTHSGLPSYLSQQFAHRSSSTAISSLVWNSGRCCGWIAGRSFGWVVHPRQKR